MLALARQPGGLAALLILQDAKLPAICTQFTVNAPQHPTGFADLAFNVLQAFFCFTFLALIGFQFLLQGLNPGTQVFQFARFLCGTLCSNCTPGKQQETAEQNSDPGQTKTLQRTARSCKPDQASTPSGGAKAVSDCSANNSINDRPVICIGGSSPTK